MSSDIWLVLAISAAACFAGGWWVTTKALAQAQQTAIDERENREMVETENTRLRKALIGLYDQIDAMECQAADRELARQNKVSRFLD